jgi:hypothetical protein
VDWSLVASWIFILFFRNFQRLHILFSFMFVVFCFHFVLPNYSNAIFNNASYRIHFTNIPTPEFLNNPSFPTCNLHLRHITESNSDEKSSEES